MPVILPPATVDAALAAQAARIKRAVAEARGEVPSETPVPLAERDLRDIDDLFDDDPDYPDDFLEGVLPPFIDGAEPPAVVATGSAGQGPATPAPTGRPPELPCVEAVEPDQEVAEAAASVVAAMRSVGESHERHLEAIELDAARRCELLTAQAELDAELIRLHARREAHAIVSAARTRTDEVISPVVADQLRDIGETFSRFAETVERDLSSGPTATDTVWD